MPPQEYEVIIVVTRILSTSVPGVVMMLLPLVWIRRREVTGRVATGVLSGLHPLLFLVSFYSLALHMQSSLGGWPGSIGTAGFPDTLLLHYNVAMWAFASLLMGGLPGALVGVFLSAMIPRLRGYTLLLGCYLLCTGLALALMSLAPSPFLYWWWD